MDEVFMHSGYLRKKPVQMNRLFHAHPVRTTSIV